MSILKDLKIATNEQKISHFGNFKKILYRFHQPLFHSLVQKLQTQLKNLVLI